MSIFEAVLLGLVQGLGEFLPISSSGHLALAGVFMGTSDVPMLFDIMLHVATLLAVLIVFRKRIGSLFAVLGRTLLRKAGPEDTAEQKLIVALLAGTAVTAVIGFAIKDVADAFSPFMISCSLVVTGFLLFFSGKYQPKKTVPGAGLVQGLIVGAAQGIGVLPGISRSGITIAASLISGLERKAAGEYSFLLSVFAITGAFILELKDADTLVSAVSPASLIAGMATAFLVGFLSLKFLLGLINRGKLGWFAFYLVPAGVSLAIYFATV
ncbi:MAG TPA: undecaprenyl-diphosphate phosphatase [Treponemataceae bacterium]|jgi:undecaprenyl-diphosphatase|nr:MAG: Undecaprenyl-diphosphatase [Spirochaetes bacterium ADurb.Bin269]TAH55657.1 MAG: undecaprenyl-diphosphate phosphatase [Treponema sp.]HOC28220.1 undecaprenyl-diphosphate phosphatase [Treponemataceae bacterium]HQL32252.1 undecaprenyl-diphosphate phosphatase [Treponemataceae bacterium]